MIVSDSPARKFTKFGLRYIIMLTTIFMKKYYKKTVGNYSTSLPTA